MATRKCQFCKEKGLLEEMKIETTNSGARKFYHEACHFEFLKDKEFKRVEQIEKDQLNEVIKKIYGVPDVPSQAWSLLEKLRGGNKVFGNQQVGKRYKEGYRYSLISETYEYCSDTIEYWNGVKNFDGFMGAFKYGLSIVIDKIYFVEQREKERKTKRQLIEKHIETVNVEEQVFETSYKVKQSNSITDFLDD